MTNSYLDLLLSIQPAPPRETRSKLSSRDSTFQDQFAATDPTVEDKPTTPLPTAKQEPRLASTGETKPINDEKSGHGKRPEDSTSEMEKRRGESISERSWSKDERTADEPDEAISAEDRAVDEAGTSANEATAIGARLSVEVSRAAKTPEQGGQSTAGNESTQGPSNEDVDLVDVKSKSPNSAELGAKKGTVDPAVPVGTQGATGEGSLADTIDVRQTKTDANGAPIPKEGSTGAEQEILFDHARNAAAETAATSSSRSSDQMPPELATTGTLSTAISEFALPKEARGENDSHELKLSGTQANSESNHEITKTQPGEAVSTNGAPRHKEALSEDVLDEQTSYGSRRAGSHRTPQADARRAAVGEQLVATEPMEEGNAIKPTASRELESARTDLKFSADAQPSTADTDAVRSDDGQGGSQRAAGRGLATPLARHQLGTSGRSSDAAQGGDETRLRVNPARFVSRVAKAFQLADDRGGQLRLRLSPPELGSIRLEVAVKQGAVAATIEADTSAARRALLDNLPLLRERLAEQNVRIEQFDVDVRDDGAGSRYDQATSGDDGRHDAGRPESRRGTDDTPDDVTTADSVPRTVSRGDETLNVVA